MVKWKSGSSIRDAFDELLSCNLVITFGAGALLFHSYSYFNYFNLYYLFSLLAGVFVFYNFKLFFDNPVKSVLTIITLFLAIVQSQLSVLSYLILFISFIITFFYHSSILKTNLRSIPYLKLFLIGLIWVLLTSFIPLVEKKIFAFEKLDFLYILERFIFLISMALLFDLRDIDFDIQNKLKTIPNRIGVFYTKFLVLVLLTLWFILCLIVYSGMIHTVVTSTFLVGTLSVLLVNRKWERTTYILIFDGLILMHSTFMSIMLSELF
jgi:4-hydroxybenzoate polyprenyltransferase